jgi:hypothetical protein
LVRGVVCNPSWSVDIRTNARNTWIRHRLCMTLSGRLAKGVAVRVFGCGLLVVTRA